MRGPRHALDTEDGLHETALAYLERYATSREGMRRFLARKVRRALGDDAPARDVLDSMLARVISRLAEARLLDDDAYAAMRARSLHRRGQAGRSIEAKLRAKGLGEEAIRGAVARLAEEAPDPEWAAACRYAARRRIGPFRAANRAEHRARDLASLGRAGFAFAVARRIVDAEDAEALRDAARGRG